MGTCIHHTRGGMGSGGTYRRPEEHQTGHEKRQGHIMRIRNVGVVVCGVEV